MAGWGGTKASCQAQVLHRNPFEFGEVEEALLLRLGQRMRRETAEETGGAGWSRGLVDQEKSSAFFSKEVALRTSSGLVAKTPYSQCRGPSSIPDQGTRSHMP